MDGSYTRYEIETRSRIQQNDNLDPIALEEIKKATKEVQCSLGEMTNISINYQFICKSLRTDWFHIQKKKQRNHGWKIFK